MSWSRSKENHKTLLKQIQSSSSQQTFKKRWNKRNTEQTLTKNEIIHIYTTKKANGLFTHDPCTKEKKKSHIKKVREK